MQQKENMRENPKELNPYLKDGEEGYPSEDLGPQNAGKRKRLEAPVAGDGFLSWRLKALKRAQREGCKLDSVVEGRWGSLADMTVGVSSKRAAHDSLKSLGGEDKKDSNLKRTATDRNRNVRMQAPNATDSLSWRRRQVMRAEDGEIFHEAALALNKFQNDGSFLQTFNGKQRHQGAVIRQEHKLSLPKLIDDNELPMGSSVTSDVDTTSSVACLSTEGTSANHLAAKALKLRLRGETKEADARLVSNYFFKQSLKNAVDDCNGENDSGDAGLVESILHSKQYNRLTCVDDEYESLGDNFKELESKNGKQSGSKEMRGKEAKQAIRAHRWISTQEERCQFCFNNPSRPKHLTISIANSCYLMLPPWEPLVDGHCLLVPTQHEGSSCNVDESVWEELRNYKKCLLQMFAKQGKDVLFIETVINLAQQRRHCLVECIPLPPNAAKQAPLYFKKAIDEAEDEWSQHDAKKLIDTKGKGLRACIPRNFPYFHVEFGLHAGFVHVIDNERDFKSDFGRKVVIGMLKLPEEEMHRRRKQQSNEQQKKAAVEFLKVWDPFDWTKMLD